VSETKIVIWRDNRWVESDIDVMPRHSHGKPEACDRCNAELHRALSQLRPMRRRKDGDERPR
jgi:hypothetical protein